MTGLARMQGIIIFAPLREKTLAQSDLWISQRPRG